MESSSVNQLNAMLTTGTDSGNAQGSDNVLGKDDFMMLLVTQLVNQDPLNPMDPEQMATQLAEFSSLEQLVNLNESVEEGLNQVMLSLDQANSLDLLGKVVRLEGNTFSLSEDEVTLHYRLQDEADEVTVYVMNEAGEQVAEISAQGTSPGEHAVLWNGEDKNGEQCPPGQYTFVVEARKDDQVLSTEPLILAEVTGVDYAGSGVPLLQTTAGEVAMSQVNYVRPPE